MFGLLKNKLTSFIKSVTGREEKKEGAAEPPANIPVSQPVEEKIPEVSLVPEPAEVHKPEPKPETKHVPEPKPAAAPIHTHKPELTPAPEIKRAPASEEKKPAPETKHTHAPVHEEKKPALTPEPEIKRAPAAAHVHTPVPAQATKIVEAKPAPKTMPVPTPAQKPAQPSISHEKRQEVAIPEGSQAEVAPKQAEKKSLFSSITGVFSQKKEEKKQEMPKQAIVHAPTQATSLPAKAEPKHAIPQQPAHPLRTEKDLSSLERRAMSDKRETAPKIGLGTAIKSFFTNEITIGEPEVADLLSDLELSLLEADVAYDVSLEVTSQLRSKLVGMKVPKGEVEARTKSAIQSVLEGIMDNDKKFLLPARAHELEKPVKILFVGPNGAGKTTTMAKVARMLMDANLTVMLSASDTFRAAAIEQAEVHAGRLGINVVKSKYGADPSSVAFDAINFARSHNIDVVLIDSAGRQDTNVNLLDELKKMNRVAKPDIKIYIGESIGGNSIIEQIRAFNEAIGIDGAILTKLDCDAKGGTAISVSRSTGIPVLYLGIGQAYSDLIPFDPHKIAQEIMN